MKIRSLCILSIFMICTGMALSQNISSAVPSKINISGKYVFYLHGGVVTILGNNAINVSNPEWGPYEYFNILDSLKHKGYHIISEIRREGIPDSFYSSKIKKQIDTLLQHHVPAQHILVLGASAGWDIGIRVSSLLKNRDMHYVLMGGCWPDTYKNFQTIELYGHFLSIIESSDPHGPCIKLFDQRKHLSSYKEIVLHTGLSHGFIYKGHRAWIDPIVQWFGR